MNKFTEHELEALLVEPESDRVERKESFKGDAANTVREAVCAFANDLPGHGAPGVSSSSVCATTEPRQDSQ